MKTYLLDSDILTYLEQKSSPFHRATNRRLSGIDDRDEVCFSILSLFEMHHGIAWGLEEDRPHFLRMLASIEGKFMGVGLSWESARIYGELKASYRKATGISGKNVKRDDVDLMIASTALEQGAILVSNDKIFTSLQKIEPNLKLENWAAE